MIIYILNPDEIIVKLVDLEPVLFSSNFMLAVTITNIRNRG